MYENAFIDYELWAVDLTKWYENKTFDVSIVHILWFICLYIDKDNIEFLRKINTFIITYVYL